MGSVSNLQIVLGTHKSLLNSSQPKNTCQIFLPQKMLELNISNPKKLDFHLKSRAPPSTRDITPSFIYHCVTGSLKNNVRIFCCCFTAKGLDHIAENILSFLDAKSLCAAEVVCKEWNRVISDGMLWKKLIERKVRTDPLWRGLSERRGW